MNDNVVQMPPSVELSLMRNKIDDLCVQLCMERKNRLHMFLWGVVVGLAIAILLRFFGTL